MGDNRLKKASLWREGMRSFERNWQQWISVAVIFFVILAACNVELIQLMSPLQAKMQELKAQKDPHATSAFFLSEAPAMAGFFVVMFFVIYAEHYMFFSFFMKKELPVEAAAPTVREFFCFVSKNIQLMFIIVVPAVAGAIVSVALQKLSPFLFVLGMLATFVFMIFLATRFYFAIPLVAGKIAEPLKISWEITRNNFWRLVGNGLILALIFLGFYLLTILVTVIIACVVAFIAKLSSIRITDPVNFSIKIVVSTVFPVLMAGVMCAYASVATRIFYQEKRQTDPNFVLTTRT